MIEAAYISIRLKYKFETDVVIKQESRNFHKHKIRVTRTIVKQIRINQTYELWFLVSSFMLHQSFYFLCHHRQHLLHIAGCKAKQHFIIYEDKQILTL